MIDIAHSSLLFDLAFFFLPNMLGYPNGHPECSSYENDIQRLKEKIDAGGDFIVTQLFFDAETYFKYLRDCRNAGITAPIIPGVLPIQVIVSLQYVIPHTYKILLYNLVNLLRGQ